MSDLDSRRRFLLGAATLAAAAPLLGLAGPAVAAPLKPLPLDNPQAKSLGYVLDAKKAKNAAYKAGSTCKNCQFFTATTGACTLFAGFSVAPAGWCAAWAKKA